MGGVRFSAADYSDYQTKNAGKTQQQTFTAKTVDKGLDPLLINFRESCDSPANPESTPIMVFVDETGSMGKLAHTIIKTGLGVIMNEIYDRKPVTDPHLLVGGIGDAYTDQYPIQPSQFEAGAKELTDQVARIVIEGNGGGNGGESYLLAWYFAAFKTKIDSMLKRGKKGYLFTVGDEPPHLTLTKGQIKTLFGDDVEADMTAQQLLDLASESWEVFHLRVQSARYAKERWIELMGERVIDVTDHEKLAEVIVSTIQVIEGHDKAAVTGSWSGDTSLVVQSAIKDLTARNKGGSDVVTL